MQETQRNSAKKQEHAKVSKTPMTAISFKDGPPAQLGRIYFILYYIDLKPRPGLPQDRISNWIGLEQPLYQVREVKFYNS